MKIAKKCYHFCKFAYFFKIIKKNRQKSNLYLQSSLIFRRVYLLLPSLIIDIHFLTYKKGKNVCIYLKNSLFLHSFLN